MGTEPEKHELLTMSDVMDFLQVELGRNSNIREKLKVISNYVTHVEARENTFKENISRLSARCIKLEAYIEQLGSNVPADD